MAFKAIRVITVYQYEQQLTTRSPPMKGILAIGDCNTLGSGDLKGSSYPERVGDSLGRFVKNCSYTMSTSREGLHLLRDNLTDDFSWIFIQFGLVDSYYTFKYSPYILYYPDNFFRKQLRSLVKKYKKTCRNSGLNKKIGETNVVPIDEYKENIIHMIRWCKNKKIILPETIPHHEAKRNPVIQTYNRVLTEISNDFDNCFTVDLYNDFFANMDNYYLDATHANEKGYSHIAKKISELLEKEKL